MFQNWPGRRAGGLDDELVVRTWARYIKYSYSLRISPRLPPFNFIIEGMAAPVLRERSGLPKLSIVPVPVPTVYDIVQYMRIYNVAIRPVSGRPSENR